MRRVTVLGSCAAWPEPGRACSGFLVEYDGFRVVLDLGFGTLPRLLELRPSGDVDAVVVTHAHSDHCVDLNGLLRVRHYGDAAFEPVPLLCPDDVARLVDSMEPEPRLADLFDVRALPGEYRVGPFLVHALTLPHHVPAVGVRLLAPGLTVAYTGDTGPHENLAVLGDRADLFVVEATHQGEQTSEHLLCAREAGRWATRARARRLMLTHFWPGADRAVSREEAGETFDGEILVADEGLVVEL
ncbi:MBL fold metallo-hydrolase [Actinophytocola gossypii]|uniref:MBL fold metallo-hydrolase n=1 Tax=Actinophytocola gossypii TaxID=2812003 RepID=A0ABT2JED4_9PSEU|nr:MBL fold metallo-hydrolase [Actinophytocola gossypii]MCT2586113.1 MBL fold metallo-hydrolase [Actinophytocola gossypii]